MTSLPTTTTTEESQVVVQYEPLDVQDLSLEVLQGVIEQCQVEIYRVATTNYLGGQNKKQDFYHSEIYKKFATNYQWKTKHPRKVYDINISFKHGVSKKKYHTKSHKSTAKPQYQQGEPGVTSFYVDPKLVGITEDGVYGFADETTPEGPSGFRLFHQHCLNMYGGENTKFLMEVEILRYLFQETQILLRNKKKCESSKTVEWSEEDEKEYLEAIEAYLQRYKFVYTTLISPNANEQVNISSSLRSNCTTCFIGFGLSTRRRRRNNVVQAQQMQIDVDNIPLDNNNKANRSKASLKKKTTVGLKKKITGEDIHWC